MSKITFLKKLLPGFLPLFVFIIADELWGTRIGLIVALGFGIIEFIWTYLKEKRLDGFILLDTLLLLALGGISILLENETFFMLKPALLESIFCIVIGYSAFSSRNLLFQMSARYLKGVSIDAEQQKHLQKSLKKLFILLVFHTLLTYYAAFFLSKKAWALISGGLFYGIFGLYILWEWGSQKFYHKKFSKEEWLPVVNEEGHVIGKASRALVHQDKKYLHPVIHLHVINSKNELLLQKRTLHKEVQPGKWDTAVGGHVHFGENVEQALKRETLEEIGLFSFQPQFLGEYIWESEKERELVFLFITTSDGPFQLDPAEISEGKFWSRKELDKTLNKSILTPNFEMEYEKIRNYLV